MLDAVDSGVAERLITHYVRGSHTAAFDGCMPPPPPRLGEDWNPSNTWSVYFATDRATEETIV